MFMDYEAKAMELNHELIKLGVLKVKKTDLRSTYNIAHTEAPPLWSAMARLGWVVSWSFLERQKD